MLSANPEPDFGECFISKKYATVQINCYQFFRKLLPSHCITL